MSLSVAVQMDPIQTIRIAGDSTFGLLLEAERRGHRLLHYGPERMSMRDGRVTARVEELGCGTRKGTMQPSASRSGWTSPRRMSC